MMIMLLAVYAMVVALMVMYQRNLMYFPRNDLLAPAQYGLKDVEAGKLKTADGHMLDYWYTQAKGEQPVLLYLHGNGGHMGYRPAYMQAAQEQGYGMLMLSYRGYGTSTGTPTEEGLYMDAAAAYAYLTSTLNIAEDRVVIFGESLGTGVAVELARGKQVRALILQAPFTSAVAIAAKKYWWLPVGLLMKDRYDSLSKLGDIHVPTLVLGAENDSITPLTEAKRLYDALAQPKRIVVFEGIGHNDFDPRKALVAFAEFDRNRVVSAVDE